MTTKDDWSRFNEPGHRHARAEGKALMASREGCPFWSVKDHECAKMCEMRGIMCQATTEEASDL